MDTGRISEGPGGSPEVLSSGSDKGGFRSGQLPESYSVSGASKPPLTDPGKRIFPSFFQRLRGRAKPPSNGPSKRLWNRWPDPAFSPAGTPSPPVLIAEHHGVHNPPRQQREKSRDDQRARENRDHDQAMIPDLMTVRPPDGEWNRDQHQDREQVDRAPNSHQPDLMDPERTDGYGQHQADPDPAEGAMRQGSLRRCQLDHAEHEGGHGREGMKRDRGSCIEQRRQSHGRCFPLDVRPRSGSLRRYVNSINIVLIPFTLSGVKAPD